MLFSRSIATTAALLAALGAAPVTAGAADAGPFVISLDPESTEIRFTLDAVAHTVRGTGRLERGELRFDPSRAQASGEIVVDARSLTTGRNRRDRHMHEKVLESATYPQIVLRPDRVDGSLDPSVRSGLIVHGAMDIHGSSHEVSIPLAITVGDERFEATGTLEVPYVEWGMKDPSFFVFRVAKSVAIEIRAAGVLRAAPPESSPE
jgi:polyisoprenoid-binding protein YceI